jgi:hypothetical protein
MQMLDAGGVKCNGKYPSFEDNRGNISNQDPQWLTLQQGKATKILLPYLFKFRRADYKFIWVDRDPFNCAKSQVKFAHIMRIKEQTKVKEASSDIMTFYKHYPIDRARSFKTMMQFGKILTISFEDIIVFPQITSVTIADYLGLALDTEQMASIVLARSIEAKSDLQIETDLLQTHLSK